VTTLERAPILLCYDGSASSLHAIDVAGSLLPGHTAVVLHIWSPIAVIAAAYGGMVSLPAYDDQVLREAALKLAAAGARVAARAGLDARAEVCEVTFEGTARSILAAADRHDASLIVLGARGLSAFKSLLLGSVSQNVAQHAHRPVLVIPRGARDDEVGGQREREAAVAGI